MMRPRSAGPTGVSGELRRAVVVSPPAICWRLTVQGAVIPRVPQGARWHRVREQDSANVNARPRGPRAVRCLKQVPFIRAAQSTRAHGVVKMTRRACNALSECRECTRVHRPGQLTGRRLHAQTASGNGSAWRELHASRPLRQFWRIEHHGSTSTVHRSSAPGSALWPT